MTHGRDNDLEELKLAADTRKFEISLFWSRSLFFWGFTAVAVTIYGAAYAKGSQELKCAAACIGVICSLVWTLTNRSSKYWQKVWEIKAENASKKVFECNLFDEPTKIEPKKWREYLHQNWWEAHFSVSKLAIAFSDFTVVVWAVLAIKTLLGPLVLPPIVTMLAILGFTIGSAIYILFRCIPDRKMRDASKS